MAEEKVLDAEKELAKEISQTEEKVIDHKITQKQANKEIEKEVKEEIEKVGEEMTKAAHALKDNEVKQLTEKIKNAKTLMIVNIKGLPSKQFQDIKKTIREYAKIKVSKKNILLRALKKIKKDSILSLKDHIQENCAFATSDLEGFELAAIFSKNKNPIFAKAGQTAPEDISIEEGPTNLMPGPAISEFGALGVQIAVEEGKISVKKSKVILHEGQEIKENVASLLQKLEIKPFRIGLEPVAIYDVETEKIYTGINIDPEETKENLRTAAGKALGFAQKIVYYCKETIGYLLAKANANAKALNKLTPAEEKAEEKPSEEKSEEKPDEKAESTEEKKEENPKEDDTQLNKPEEK